MAIHCSDNRRFMCVKSIIVERKSLFTKRQRDIENSINKYFLVYYSVSLVIVTTFYIDCSAIFTRSSASSGFIEFLEFGSCLPFQYKARGITEIWKKIISISVSDDLKNFEYLSKSAAFNQHSPSHLTEDAIATDVIVTFVICFAQVLLHTFFRCIFCSICFHIAFKHRNRCNAHIANAVFFTDGTSGQRSMWEWCF